MVRARLGAGCLRTAGGERALQDRSSALASRPRLFPRVTTSPPNCGDAPMDGPMNHRERFRAGVGIKDIAARMNTSMRTVSIWSSRFETVGPRWAGGQRRRWSVRSMARHAGISHSTVQRIWAKNELKPHVTRTFKLSNDPKFEAKFWDVIGL
jgi:lambda repressor-like predicted transcriptional regulator